MRHKPCLTGPDNERGCSCRAGLHSLEWKCQHFQERLILRHKNAESHENATGQRASLRRSAIHGAGPIG